MAPLGRCAGWNPFVKNKMEHIVETVVFENVKWLRTPQQDQARTHLLENCSRAGLHKHGYPLARGRLAEEGVRVPGNGGSSPAPLQRGVER